MNYGQFVGRVGALAVALGIGLVAPAVAVADPADDSTAGESSTDTTGPKTKNSEPAKDSEATDSRDSSEAPDSEAPQAAEDPSDDPEDAPQPDTAEEAEPPAEIETPDAPDIEEVSPETTAGTPITTRTTVHSKATAHAADDDPTPATEHVSSPAEQRTSLVTESAHPAAASVTTATPALRSTVVTVSSVPLHPTVATPKAAAVTTGLTAIVSKFLELLGIGQAGTSPGVPLPSFEFVTAVFAAIRREVDRLFANDGPTAAVILTGQTEPGVVKGALNGTDPQGDPLTYKVIEAPKHGSVVVDAAGNYTYTANQQLAATGGTDTFVVQVRDAGFHLMSTGPTSVGVPITVTVTANGALTKISAQQPVSAALSATTGTTYHVVTNGPDIVGFNPAKDKLDLGDVSVHNFIVVDTAEGVGFRNPWSGETAIITGVSLGQLTINSFAPVINAHLQQDLSGALAWENGITPQANTVYARSHEVGQIDRVAFNPTTDVVDFRYFGTREQIYMLNTPDGVVISNAGTGQALILQGVNISQLSVRNFIFHSAQVREDKLNEQLGIGAVPDSQVRPQGVPVAGTTTWPTTAGNGAPPTGVTGTTTTISWLYGSNTVLNFNTATDKLDFGWVKSTEFDVTELNGSTRITINNNNQTYTLTGVAIGALQSSNIIALDDTTRAKWQNLIFSAAQPVSRPSLSVSDGRVAEGNANTSVLVFTVTLSRPATTPVTVSYSTSNGTATAAGSDYVPTVGTLTFAPGDTSKTVLVTANSDTLVELDEQFTLNLASPVNAAIADGAGTGTIVNDDIDRAPATPPAISIADLAVTEGAGEHSHFMFVVTLDKASTDTVTVRYATSNGTATAGVDYTATTGTITFAPGVTSQQVHVDIIGDVTAESAETFVVTLSSPTGATIGDGTATGTIIDDDTVTPGPVVTPGNPAGDLWGEAFFAPYVDMGLWPVPDLLAISRARGTSLLTLGFLQATPDGKLAWAGLPVLTPDSSNDQAKAINQSIAAFQAAGGDVMISIGGASGTSLAQWYATHGRSAQDLANAYSRIIDTYKLNRIDFDIEGAAVADPASIALGSQALKLLQLAHPDLEIVYTLPVLPTGLTADGLNVVRSALRAGVKLDAVNVMAMDYGESAAPTSGPNAKTMGAYAIDAANATYAQLTALYPSFGQSFGWNQLGVTPMIGVNDVTTEVFTVADAQALEDFARAKGLGMLSIWSIARDTPGSVGQATYNASGLTIAAGSFSNVFNDYGKPSVIVGAPPALSIGDLSVTEGNGGHSHFMFVVALDKPGTGPVTVSYATSNGTATAGVDYAASSGVLTFAPGVTSQTVHVDILGDTAVEPNETFTVTLSNVSGATIADASATGTIVNDDAAVLTPGNSSVRYVVADNWGSGFVANVTVSAGTSGFNGWTVEFDSPAQISSIWNAEIASHSGSHYVVRNVAWNATVGAGQTVEFGFQATPGSASAAATNFTVNGQSSVPTKQLPKIAVADATVAESNSGTVDMAFVVTLSEASNTAITTSYLTSNGTATAGVDYKAGSGTVTFAPGVVSQQVRVAVFGDTTVESNETFTLTLSNPTGATIADGSAVGTITNDDVSPVTSGAASVAYAVNDNWGSGFTASVTVTAGASGLDGWTVEFDAPAQISSIWNAEIASHVGNHYVVRNTSWNTKVGAGKTVAFGYQASPGGTSSTASTFVVNGVRAGATPVSA